MTVEEFLNARLDELENWSRHTEYQRKAFLALIKSQREIIEIHRTWPHLIETQPRVEHREFGESISIQMIQSIMWITRDEYTKRFGVEAPTASFIKSMLLAWRDHPDFDELWLNGHR